MRRYAVFSLKLAAAFVSVTGVGLLVGCQQAGQSKVNSPFANVAQNRPIESRIPTATPTQRASAIRTARDGLREQSQSILAAQREAEPKPKVMPKPTVVASLGPTELKPPAQRATDAIASTRPPKDEPEIATRQSGKPLARFRAKLAGLKSGSRTKPVTVLHIGDSHVASDSFTRGIRRALQNEYGNAGRGTVIPARAFKYGVADQVKMTSSGSWKARTALRVKEQRFGLSGVSVATRSSRAKMTLVSQNGAFDWAQVTVVSGPSQGRVTLSAGGVEKTFDARAASAGSKTFRIDARGSELEVRGGGGSRIEVLSWATGRNTPGVRYVNFGLIGATVAITRRFDPRLVANDVKAIAPDLIVYGYGTNEGFNDNLDLKRYARRGSAFMQSLADAAPQADLVYIGAASGLRRKGRGVNCGGGWKEPRRLGPLRETVQQMAKKQNAAYWDWSDAMGGRCAINEWASKRLASKDRVHLTSRGYARSANAFAAFLMGDSVKVAQN
ncbi:MAG: GDSL-type esterase/lipase family protein [Pseudomonadota bacterium]